VEKGWNGSDSRKGFFEGGQVQPPPPNTQGPDPAFRSFSGLIRGPGLAPRVAWGGNPSRVLGEPALALPPGDAGWRGSHGEGRAGPPPPPRGEFDAGLCFEQDCGGGRSYPFGAGHRPSSGRSSSSSWKKRPSPSSGFSEAGGRQFWAGSCSHSGKAGPWARAADSGRAEGLSRAGRNFLRRAVAGRPIPRWLGFRARQARALTATGSFVTFPSCYPGFHTSREALSWGGGPVGLGLPTGASKDCSADRASGAF